MIRTGELAKRTGLTVRTLRYYDAIGLLTPSGRSDAGYRLYNDGDIARLRNIQALRDLGFPLSDIQRMLDAGDVPLAEIVARQVHALNQEISRAAEIRDRLSVLQDRVAAGRTPKTEDWLPVLELMTVHRKYMTAREFKLISDRRKEVEAKWLPLVAEIRLAIQEQAPPSSARAQSLARRSMDISMRWMQNDADLVARWWTMSAAEASTRQLNGVEPDVQRYIAQAARLRHTALLKYLSLDDISRLHKGLEERWACLEKAARRAIRQKLALDSEPVRQLVTQWSALMDDLTDHDPELRKKFITALESEPFLQLGSPLSADVRSFVRRAAAHLKSNLSPRSSESR